MSSQPEIPAAPEMPNFAPRYYGIALLVAIIVISGTWLVGQFTANDLARDMQSWQEKLNLIAESRKTDITNWVGGNFKELRALADNPSLQLYMTELQAMKPPATPAPADTPAESPVGNEPGQKTYLRNLLVFTAQRAGFSSENPTTFIPANVKQESKNGLALLNDTSDFIVSTVLQEAVKDTMLEDIKHAPTGQESMIDLRKMKDGTPYLGFVVPVFSIQGDHNAASQIGRVIGIKTMDGNLFGLLKHPGITEKTLECILVRNTNDNIEYLSPLLDGTAALGKEVAPDAARLAEASLIQTPGNFLSDHKDYRGKAVLATSRTIAGTPWTLIVKIDKQEALSESDQRRASLVTIFSLIIMVIVAIVVANWWHSHSKRSLLMSTHFRALAARATAQEQLLRLVADNQPESIYILDAHNIYHFANHKAANAAHMTTDSIAGKTLADVRGGARAEQIAEQCDKTRKHGQIVYDVQHVQQDGEESVVRSAYIPLEHIPVATLPQNTPGVLIVEQDISEVVHEREQRIETHRQLIETLVKLVDKRDPFAANHSLLVSQLAQEVAIEMELDAITVETTHTAGSLMNIGKIVVPTELLTKTGALTAEEKNIIQESIYAAANLLKGISFEGPVAETLREWREKWDGSGPLGLRGESILISARVIAVANAFIGMISPRSWRTAIPIESAHKFLLDDAGTHFDRRVVIALLNYIENHHGRAWLQKIAEENKV